ncbi:MAG: hypothetical protein LUQ05_04030, partial [Methanoregula sp.]|nr:hypothetical protein [Methanoregula sp.]
LRFTVSSNQKKMLVEKDGKYAVIDLPQGNIELKETIDLSNMMVKVNYQEEWNQIFDESWRQMRDFFYVPNMHGVDWQAMHDKYSCLLPYVNHRNDLTYIIGEMIAELNIGHAYVNSGSGTITLWKKSSHGHDDDLTPDKSLPPGEDLSIAMCSGYNIFTTRRLTIYR